VTPRAFTRGGAVARCPRCALHAVYCLCGEAPRLRPRTGLVVVRHLHEAEKTSNTARIALLALPDALLLSPDEARGPAGEALLSSPDTWLLLDGPGALPMEEAPWGARPPARLALVDGTWGQARRMAARLPALAALPRLYLRAPPPARARLRQPPTPGGRATIEAMADALALLGEEEIARDLLALQARHVEAVRRQRGVPRAPGA
jgi:DTW domain-containing protein